MYGSRGVTKARCAWGLVTGPVLGRLGTAGCRRPGGSQREGKREAVEEEEVGWLREGETWNGQHSN